MNKFKLKIVTPQGVYQEIEVNQLNLCTTEGQIGILAHHIPLATIVEISKMSYVIDNQRYEYAIGGGFVYVGENETKLIVDSIESKDDIDLTRAQAAKSRAKERIEHPNKDTDLKRAEIALKKAINRINVKELN